jgi:uncharacterized repeat protein (TIGR01451 family)
MKRRQKERGQTLVEFALILPVLLMLIIGIFEFGRIIFLYANLFNAAREGARYGLINPQDYQGILRHSQERVTLAEVNDGHLSVSMDTGPDSDDSCTMAPDETCQAYAVVGNRVIVGINYVISPITPFFEPIIGDLNLNTSAARTIQRVSGAVSAPAPPTGPQPGEPGEALPELSVVKSASPDPVAPGDTISYDITVTNNGAGDATGVIISDDLDGNTTLVAGSVNASTGTVTTSGNSITVDVGDLSSGASVSVFFQATVDDPLPAGVTSITNLASASSNEDDTRSGEVTIAVDAGPVLQIAKSASPAYASPGDTILYAVRITNNGNQEDTQVEFSDTLPSDVSLIADSAGTTKGSTTTSGNSITVDVGTLASGSSVDITFQATIASSENFETGETAITNEGVVTSDTYPDGVSDSATTVVTVGPYLDARKSGGLYQDVDRDGTIGPGDVLYYELVFTNVGNQDANRVQITDVLDTNTTMVAGSAKTSQGTISSNDTSLTAEVGTLSPGAEVSVSFRATIDDISFEVTEVSNRGSASCVELPQVTFETNTVRTPVTSDPIIIDKPVRVGDTWVEGTALANQALTFQVLRSDIPTITGESDANGNFQFDVSNITLTEGDYVLVKGYGTQDIARVEAAPVGPYIDATHADCSADTVTLEGGNWEETKPGPQYNNDVKIIIFCDGQEWYGRDAPDYEWTGSFTYPDVPFTAQCPSSEPHTVTGRVYYKYGSNRQTALTDEVEVNIPAFCPIEPDLPPDIKVESMDIIYPFSTAMVAPQFGTYEPLTVTVVLTNTTTTDVTSLFAVDLFVDPDPDTYLFEQESVDQVGIQVLQGASSVRFDMYVEEGFSDTEPHTLTVKADTFEQILEHDETNNILALTAQAGYTNTAPTPTPTITSTLDPGAIEGETWLILQDELMPQSGVKVYAQTILTDTTVTYGPVYSDNLGRFTLTDLPPATYAVTGEYELLEDSDGDGTLERVLYQNTVEVQVTSGVTTTGVYLILEPVGTQ